MEENVIYFEGYVNDKCERLYIDLTNATLSDLISIKSGLKRNFSSESDVLESIIYDCIHSEYKEMTSRINRRKRKCRRFKQKWEGK